MKNFIFILIIVMIALSCSNNLKQESFNDFLMENDSSKQSLEEKKTINNVKWDSIDSDVKDSIIYYDNTNSIKWYFQVFEGDLEGDCISYYKSGEVKTKQNFKKGYLSGIREEYNSKGELYIKSYYDKGCLVWKEFYNKNKELYRKLLYNKEQHYMSLLYNENKIDTGYVEGRGEKACKGFYSIEGWVR